MADAKASFAVQLEDLISPQAKKAAASITKLETTLKTAKTQLAGAKAQLSLAKELGDIEGYRKYSKLVTEGKQSVFGLTQQLEQMPAASGTSESSLASFAATLGPIAAGAAVALAAVVALGIGFAKLYDLADKATSFNEQTTAMFDALGAQGPESGKKTLAMLDDLATKLPQSRAKLAEWTKQLEASGVVDLDELREQLKATASAQAILGDQGATAYETLREKVSIAAEAHTPLKLAAKSLTQLYRSGLNVTDIASRMGISTTVLATSLKAGTIDAKKFGDAMTESLLEKGKKPLDALNKDFDTIKLKGLETFMHLFDSVDVDPISAAIQEIFTLGDQGNASGQAIKAGLVPAMNAIIRAIGHAIIEGELLFLKIELGALRAYTSLKPLIGAFETISGIVGAVSAARTKVIDTAESVGIDTGAVRNEGLAVAATAVTGGLSTGFAGVATVVGDVLSALGDAKAQEIAHAAGVASGEAAIAGIREGVDAHSPSVAAMRIGGDIAAGLGGGMENSTIPERAARTISGNALGGLASGQPLFGSRGGEGGGANIGPITIHITAPEGVTDAHALSVIGLSTVLERFQIGAGR